MNSLIDEALLQDLAQLGQSSSFLQKIVVTYLVEARGLLAVIATAVDTLEFDQLRSVAHALHGNSANVGALEMRAISHSLEHATDTGLELHGVATVRRLQTAFSETTEALEAFVAREVASRDAAARPVN